MAPLLEFVVLERKYKGKILAANMTESGTAANVGLLGGARTVASMKSRSPDEAHRASTPLELLFDLVFVVAISQAANGLHHAIADVHVVEGLMGYLMVFFAIWWAWMNFTWFASAYDCDDVPYRLAVFVQIAGALILAGGVPRMFETHVPNMATLTGYVVMRLAIVAQWLRAAAADPDRRVTARRYAAGITILQVAWVGMLLVPHLWLPGFITLAAAELAIPVWAERAAPTTWHPQHITERYGLLTLIVLGESILAATVAVQSAVASGEALPALLPLIGGGLLIAFSMWWMYFDRPVHDLLTSLRKAIVWGYGHYLVFAAAAAVGAGLAVSVDQATHHAHVSAVGAGAAVAIPVAVYLVCLWFLHDRPEYRETRWFGPIAAALVLLTPFTGHAVPLIGLILAALVAVKIVLRARQAA
jgi:low temperature requirement protein LtrA